LIETAFLSAVEGYLASAGLSPAPATIGVAEPVATLALPALVLSLEAGRRPKGGIGERSFTLTGGALPWRAVIDLANPVLPEEPSLRLLSADRLELTLPHGGLVRTDGTEGPLGPADLQVSVAETPRPVVTGTPAGLEVRASPTVGKLTFATALPLMGRVQADYRLGQWERRVERLLGVLRVDVCTGTPEAARTLGDGVADALLDTRARMGLSRLVSIQLSELGAIGAPELAFASARRRTLRLPFEFERDVDRPDSSGGIIRRVSTSVRLSVAQVARDTGAITETLITENS
jgi:hypothetical protein